MAIDTTFEFVEMTPEEMASLKHERVSNAKSYEIAKAIMASGLSNGAVSVKLANEAKGRSLAGTVNSVLKRFESPIRTIFRVNTDTKKQYLIFASKTANTAEAPTEAPAEAPAEASKKSKRQ